jgi:hypothetical protein
MNLGTGTTGNLEYYITSNSVNYITVARKSRQLQWIVRVALMGKARNVGGKQPTGRPRGWEDNIKTDLKEIGSDNGKWVVLAPNRVCWLTLVVAVLNLRVILPQTFIVGIHVSRKH